MNNHLPVLLLASLLLPLLVYLDVREDHRGILPVKTGLSILFLVAALVQPRLVPPYFLPIFLGLCCCLIGDVFLALPRGRMFLPGLLAFLVGHVFYALGFFSVAPMSAWTWVGAVMVLFSGLPVFLWLSPYLGPMRSPVLAYVVVIGVMVVGAWSLLGHPDLALNGRIMAFTGALCFYISDIFVARDRFLQKAPLNRIAGLPLYYTGQFLIAFSIGCL